MVLFAEDILEWEILTQFIIKAINGEIIKLKHEALVFRYVNKSKYCLEYILYANSQFRIFSPI